MKSNSNNTIPFEKFDSQQIHRMIAEGVTTDDEVSNYLRAERGKETLTKLLYEMGHSAVDIAAFDIVGDETEAMLEEYARDYDSEISSEKSEYAATRSARHDAAEEQEAYNRELYGQ